VKTFLLWCIVLALSWPLALLALVFYPLVWILLIPFRIAGIAVDGVLGLIRGIVMLPPECCAVHGRFSQVIPHRARFPASRVLTAGGRMNNRVAGLIAAGLSLAAAPRTVMSASPARPSVGEVDILVDGTPQPRFAHEGRWYVEARKGREYAIRLKNPYGVRVAVALSVDGLNTIDARESTAADARKWVLAPYESVTISGWQTSQAEARRFEFTTEARSYGQAIGKTANLGVISAVFFRERVPAVMSDASNDYAGKAQASRAPAPLEPAAQSSGANNKAADEYAATGMGRRTGHAVTQVSLDLEDAPARALTIRYEFHPQLVRLGILPADPAADPLQRRERAQGFTPGFCPQPPRQR
jgi:hypothetical protein